MSCSTCKLPIGHPSLGRVCPFCSCVFSRVDGARRHAKRCPQRADRKLPSGKRGRKALSYDQCSRAKVHCNARGRTSCGHCISRGLTCTFRRTCTCAGGIRGAEASVRETHQAPSYQDHHRGSVYFLLNATDETRNFNAVEAVSEEPDGELVGPIGTTSALFDTSDFINPALLLPSSGDLQFESVELDALFLPETGCTPNLRPTLPPQEDKLANRIALLEEELAQYAHGNHCLHDQFEVFNFRGLFNLSNVYEFASTFCRKRHYRYPIIHWPTLALEDVALPLLLVIGLTGVTYTYRPGHNKSFLDNARKLYPLASSYVFNLLEARLKRLDPNSDASEAMQLCQAALLMYGLLIDDPTMQREAISTRLPALVDAIRRLGFTSCRHDLGENWGLFLRMETVIRIVAWTFCADCLATLSFNHPPLLTISEIVGDLPCEPTLWNADTASSFYQLRSSEQQQNSASLKSLMSSLLSEDVRFKSDKQSIHLFHLHVALCGLQQVIFNMHVSMNLPSQLTKVLRVLATWRSLWDLAMEEMPREHRIWLGVARHVPGVAYLSKRVIEVASGPEAGRSRYLERIPSWSTMDIHRFIHDFVAKP